VEERWNNTFESFEEFEQRMKLEGYYGDFSYDTRKKLLAKNLPKVSSVYDILYAQTREEQLKSNVYNINSNLDIKSESIRLNALRKNLEEKLDFDAINNEARAQSQKRNTLTKTSNDLQSIGDKKRKELLSKNIIGLPLSDASKIKENQLASNIPTKTNIDTYAQTELKNELGANIHSNTNIDTYAQTELNNELSSNIPSNTNIDTYAQTELKNELGANIPSNTNIDTYAQTELKNELSSNIPSNTNIDTYAQTELNNELSSNIPSNVNIDTYAQTELSNELSVNVPIGINIDTYAQTELSNELSTNLPSNTNIDTYAQTELNNELSTNVPIQINIDTYAQTELSNELSTNVPIQINIDTYAQTELSNELSTNVPIGINIDTYAQSELNDELSANVPIQVNIDTYAQTELNNELSTNVPIQINIDTYAQTELNNELSTNVPIGVNIDTYAQTELNNELSTNVPIQVNIDTYAQTELNNELSTNVPIQVNIDTYAQTELNNELSTNVPIGVNIDTYAQTELNNELSTNVPIQVNIDTYAQTELNNELSTNTPIGINIDTYAQTELNNELSTNTPIGINIDTYAQTELNNELSENTPSVLSLLGIDAYALISYYLQTASNVPSDKNLDNFLDVYGNLTSSAEIKDVLLSKNVYPSLGVNFYFNGANVFLPPSDLLTQGEILRPLATIRNEYNLDYNQYSAPLQQYNNSSNNYIILPQIPLNIYSFNSLDAAKEFYNTNSHGLQWSNNIEAKIDLNLIGNYGVNSKNEQIIVHGKKTFVDDYGDLTNAIRAYNVARNYAVLDKAAYQISITEAQKELKSILDTIANSNNNLPGHSQQGSNLFASYTNTPMLNGAGNKMIEETNNSPSYDYVGLLKPNSLHSDNSIAPQNYPIDTAASMASQTITTNNIENLFLLGETAPTTTQHSQGSTGVRRVIDIISKADPKDVSFGANFKRNQTKFVIRDNSNLSKPKYTYQRYTYENPYILNASSQPQFNFSFTNYANGITMYFPPYIKSYRNAASADWVAHDFLGRPESVYTYNKSNREGSIQFVVLTDYAESVQFGFDYPSNTIQNFNSSTNFSSQAEQFQISDIETKISNLQKDNSSYQDELNRLQAQAQDFNAESNLKQLIAENNATISSLQQQLKLFSPSKFANPYREFNGKGANYQQALNSSQSNPWDVSTTLTYLQNIQKNMLFVPAYFSGSKADFVTKMDFLTKMTRPARNPYNSSFAFTKPPICHVVLGDWFDYDIVIDSVSFDYSESIWTLDSNLNSRVQPMYATVDVNFKIVGAYGGGGTPPLATDVGGFYDIMTSVDISNSAILPANNINNTVSNVNPPNINAYYESRNPGGHESFL